MNRLDPRWMCVTWAIFTSPARWPSCVLYQYAVRCKKCIDSQWKFNIIHHRANWFNISHSQMAFARNGYAGENRATRSVVKQHISLQSDAHSTQILIFFIHPEWVWASDDVYVMLPFILCFGLPLNRHRCSLAEDVVSVRMWMADYR